MAAKYIKFISANLCMTVLLIITLFKYYTTFGSVALFVGSGLLFLGTLLDKKKAIFGIADKLAYIVFISLLTEVVIWYAYMNEHSRSYSRDPEFNFWIIVFSAGMVVLSSVSSGRANYITKRVFKYAGLLSGTLACYFLFRLDFINYLIIPAVILFFFFYDVYECKAARYRANDNVVLPPDRAYWMALGLSVAFIIANIFYGVRPVIFDYYFSSMDQNYYGNNVFLAIASMVSQVLTPVTVPIFTLMMVALSGLFAYADKLLNRVDYADSYLALSAGGCCLILTTYANFWSWLTFLFVVLSFIMFIVFGFSIVSRRSDKNNPVFKVLNAGKFAPFVIPVAITTFTNLSIVFVYEGYIASWLTLICGLALVLIAKKIFTGYWIAGAMRWQMILVAILLFCGSISVVEGTLSSKAVYLLLAFSVSSVVLWIHSIRDGVWGNKYLITKIINSVLFGVISLFAVLPY